MDLDKIFPYVIALLLIVVVIAVGARVLGDVKDTFAGTDNPTKTDEELTDLENLTGQVVDDASAHVDFVSMDTSSVVVWNKSGGELLVVANYTASSNGTIVLTDQSTYNGSDLYINYTYTVTDRNELYNATADSEGGTSEVAGFAGIIGLTVAAVIILMILLGTGLWIRR